MKNLLFFLIIFIFTQYNLSYSHHSKNGQTKIAKANLGLSEKDIENKYCTTKVKKVKKESNNTQAPPKETDKENLDYSTNSWKISNYHETKSILLGNIISVKSKNEIDWKFEVDKTKVVDVLRAYCLHYKDSKSPKENKEIIDQILEVNGIPINKKSTAKLDSNLFEKGILIPKDLVGKIYYSTPDYLIKVSEEKKIKDKKKAEDIKKFKEEQNWISENRPKILEKAEQFKQKQDDRIIDITGKLSNLKKEISNLNNEYAKTEKAVKKMFELDNVQNKSNEEISKLYEELFDKKEQYFPDSSILKNIDASTKKIEDEISSLKLRPNYKAVVNLIQSIKLAKSKKSLMNNQKNIEVLNPLNLNKIEDDLNKTIQDTKDFTSVITEIDELRKKVIELDRSVGSGVNYLAIGIVIIVILLAGGISYYVYSQNRKLSSLTSATDSAGRKFSELEGQLRSTSEKLKSVSSGRGEKYRSETEQTSKSLTQQEIVTNKFDELLFEYSEAIENFSKVASFKQKWNGVALNRKERQEGSKTILINSSRAFEKSEIWCLNFDNKYFAFPGSTVKSNMAAYMNLDFEKAQRDFKGIFSITSGSNYKTEPAVLRKGGAGFVVERPGKLTFPQ